MYTPTLPAEVLHVVLGSLHTELRRGDHPWAPLIESAIGLYEDTTARDAEVTAEAIRVVEDLIDPEL